MLILGRKSNEKIVITVGGVTFSLLVVDVRGDKVRIGFDAPNSVQIVRAELVADGNEFRKELEGQ